ncbi:MAG TPA: ATP-dependent DNA ligase [Streptosporangiaceae bacterium]
MLLSEVVATSAAVARTPGRLAKIDLIARLLARVPADEVPVAVAFLSGDLTQRQIGVGYSALTGLPGAGQAEQAEEGLFRPAAEPVLTLAETDATFEAIGSLAGSGSRSRRNAMLTGLMSRATRDERQFLVRLLAGDLGQGAQEGVMLEAVARACGVPAAEVRRAHQLRGSLPEVARAALVAAADGPDAVKAVLRAFTLTVGQPVRPMLAASAPSIDAALARISPAALEWKIDGIRVQIHRDRTLVRVFTRTLDDITDRVPEIVALARSLDVASAVIDGEAVALRPDGRPYAFQVTSARVASQSVPRPAGKEVPGGETGATSTGGATGMGGTGGTDGGTSTDGAVPAAPGRSAARAAVPLTAFLFDVLHLDGRDLMDLPSRDRFARLAAIVPDGRLIPRLVTAQPEAAAEFFAGAIAAGHEGVVAKSLDAPYRAGRRGGDWIKVKPRATLDLVILAAEWGHGRRGGLLSNLHLGARDPRTGGFVMLGKTFKGLTDVMLRWQTERLLELADRPDAAEGVRAQAAAHQAGEGAAPARWPHGVVRVRPELVAEIAFDGVQESSRYPGGVALRFARVLRYRDDKSAHEADTIDTVRALWPHAAAPADTESRD